MIPKNVYEKSLRSFLEPIEHGEEGKKPAFVPTGVLPVCLEAIRIHGHDLPPAVYAAAKRRQR
jgi:hypothetical protein